ncbi:MAG: hypothetical protein EOM72_07050 [Opitutae bacterium]|nr:hypothetical protein [Opitutae bacterium]
MREDDIARKCAVALAGVGFMVCVSVLASRWSASSVSEGGRPADSTSFLPVAAAEVAPSPASTAKPVDPVPVPAASAPPAATATQKELLERKAFQLEMENARLRGRLDDMLNWILDNVRGTFPLPEGQMAHLRLAPVDTNMAVSDEVAQLLRLNDLEIDRLDAAFMGTKALLQDLETENISVDKPSESQVVLNIPPYAEDGQLVREELYGELKKTLGAARFDRFLQVAGAGLDEQFDYFGEADRTLQFEAVQDAVSGDSQLFVRDERVVPSRDDPLRQDITASERIVTELPREYYPYWNWLPDSVTRFFRSN